MWDFQYSRIRMRILHFNIRGYRMRILYILLYYYVFHDRVTLFFADNFSTECRITMKFLHNFFQTLK